MTHKDQCEFTCSECGSHELGYQQYVKAVSPVEIHEDGSMEYKQSQFDENDSLAVSNGFCCLKCGELIKHCGCRMETEGELRTYLTKAPETREQQQKEYDRIEEAQMEHEEQKEKQPLDWI